MEACDRAHNVSCPVAPSYNWDEKHTLQDKLAIATSARHDVCWPRKVALGCRHCVSDEFHALEVPVRMPFHRENLLRLSREGHQNVMIFGLQQ
jgi:hypothetical protein